MLYLGYEKLSRKRRKCDPKASQFEPLLENLERLRLIYN